MVPDVTQISEVNTNFKIDLGINESGHSNDFGVLGLTATSYIDGVLEEDLLVFATPMGGLGESGQLEMNLSFGIDETFVPQRALRDAQFDISIVQSPSFGKQEQRSFVMSGVEEGSILRLTVNETTEPRVFGPGADLGEDDEETNLMS